MMVPTTSASNSADLEADMVRLRASSIGTCIPLKDKDNLSDIYFICGDDCSIIQSHRVILRSWSNFFAKVIESSLTIKGPFPVAPYIVLKEVPGQDLKDIFKFIYYGEMIVERCRLGSILQTARFLEINRLPELLEKAEQLRDDINTYTMKEISFKDAEMKDANSDAASSSTTIIRSDAGSKSSGRNSNSSNEANKSSDDNNDVFEANTSSQKLDKFVVEPETKETMKPVETRTFEQNITPTSSEIESTLYFYKRSSSYSPPKSINPIEERLRQKKDVFANIIRTPQAMEPVETLKPEKNPLNSETGIIEEIDLSD